MMNFDSSLQKLEQRHILSKPDRLKEVLAKNLDPYAHGDLSKWLEHLRSLPQIAPSQCQWGADAVTIGDKNDIDDVQRAALENQLLQFRPWRKGPYNLFGVYIDSEWRSDWKWQRLENFIQPLKNRRVMDVGCGNGYHCWRMYGAGAELVVGVDPYLLSVIQFQTINHFARQTDVMVLPLKAEAIGDSLAGFDTVFSMGVLYHRRSPMDHLLELRSFLRAGGQLILETLVIDGPPGQVLVPEDRYAGMRNIWFIPSCLALEIWLRRCGFHNIRQISVTITRTDEQRSTRWMDYASLRDFLDPKDTRITIEGYPSPQRAIYLAEIP